MADSPRDLSIRQLADAYRQGTLRPSQVTEAYLEAIRPGDVYRLVTAERARAQARRAEENFAQGIDLGPLQGVPIALKDLIDTQGDVSAAGSKALADKPPAAQDCPAAARLDQAGAVFLGKTTMTELAFSGIGINPHYGTPACALDEARVPGGSSSGSGVVVAKKLACAAIGSDTGGSVRIPSAFNGIVGLKTTDGLIPTEGCVPLSTTLDTLGPMTRSVEDAWLLLGGMLEPSQAAMPTRAFVPLATQGLRLLAPTTLVHEGIDPEVAQGFAQACTRLKAAGLQLEQREVPELQSMQDAFTRHGSIANHEAWALYEDLIAERGDMLDPRVSGRILRAKDAKASDYIRLHYLRAQLQRSFWQTYADYQALIMPTVAILPPRIDALESDDAYFANNAMCLRNTQLFNFLGASAVTVPCGRSQEGLSIGFMVVTRPRQELLALSLGAVLEASSEATA